MNRIHRALPLIAALFVIAAADSSAQVGPSLPEPTGRYKVGRTSFHWVDSRRPEPATPAPADFRELHVQVWYPAARPTGAPASYLPGVERLSSSPAAGALSNLFGPAWPAIASQSLRSHSYENARVASGAKLPILIFSPGGGVPVAAYTAQMEELASHGYAVVGVDDTYDTRPSYSRTDEC